MAVRKPRILSTRGVAEAQRHLIQSCNVMARLVATHGSCPLGKRGFRPFQTLVTSIISQQLSAKVAHSIENRVLNVVPTFCPTGFISTSFETLRGAGLSMTKVKYIKEMAERVAEGRLNFDAMTHLPDDEVITALTELPGVGRWTAEMFLIFGLKRPDVLATGDAGLQRAVRLLYGDNATLENTGQLWKPYCSVASWYLWRHLDSPQPPP